MSYEVEVTLKFQTGSKEQAELIEKFLFDAQALLICENSTYATSGVMEMTELPEYDKSSGLEFNNPVEAFEVVGVLKTRLSLYGYFTRGDYHDFLGIGSTWEDACFGWTSVDEFQIQDAKILMPPAKPVGR